MPSSLQKGINAAKAGRMQEALNFMKDAIIEEPQNADVWVWIAAIIDDLEKQEIFLKKALEIDPNNIPAQRGLAYLQKRQQDQRNAQGGHLSDHTSPISPFPPSNEVRNPVQDSDWSSLKTGDLNETAQAGSSPSQGGFFQGLPKLNTLEIILIGVIVVVFCFIGLLAASAVFDFDLPLGIKSLNKPSLSEEPPYPGVFLYVDGIYFNIGEYQGIPTQKSGIPTSYKEVPIIVVWETTADPDQMRLIYETGEYIPFEVFAGKSDADLLRPKRNLQTGLYCFQQAGEGENAEEPLYWCFSVDEAPLD
jgi:hypothetical protein